MDKPTSLKDCTWTDEGWAHPDGSVVHRYTDDDGAVWHFGLGENNKVRYFTPLTAEPIFKYSDIFYGETNLPKYPRWHGENVAPQVGGTHYRPEGITQQHWDYAWERKFDFFQYNITKRLERWKRKAGLEDLYKARQELNKYIELLEAAQKTTGLAGNTALGGD